MSLSSEGVWFVFRVSRALILRYLSINTGSVSGSARIVCLDVEHIELNNTEGYIIYMNILVIQYNHLCCTPRVRVN